MTSNRTVTPGFQDENSKTHLNEQGDKTNFGQKAYSPESNNSRSSGTIIPGQDNQPLHGSIQQEQSIGKPIVGFLVSVSRVDEGEYWVLRQGQNTIGSGSNCSIILSESSVSGLHAVLAVHRNPSDNNRLSVGMMDRGSSNGVFINGNYIGFNPCQCKNLDKIKIGNYELLLMLFDSVEFEMKRADNFISKDDFDYADRDLYPSNDGTQYGTRV